MRSERETGDITCSPGSQLAASSKHWPQGTASAWLDKLGGTLPEQVGAGGKDAPKPPGI